MLHFLGSQVHSVSNFSSKNVQGWATESLFQVSYCFKCFGFIHIFRLPVLAWFFDVSINRTLIFFSLIKHIFKSKGNWPVTLHSKAALWRAWRLIGTVTRSPFTPTVSTASTDSQQHVSILRVSFKPTKENIF